MRLLRFAVLFALALTLGSCGGGSSDTINGTWSGPLSGTESFNLTATLTTQAATTDLMITNLSLTPQSPCFTGGMGTSGSFTSSGIGHGNIMGTFRLSIGSIFPQQTQNLLDLEGNVNGNTITGTWSLTGGVSTGCVVGSGTFTLNKM